VSNCVDQIQELTEPASWNHVKTKENLTDAIFRGISPMQLIQLQLWWNGPQWVSLDRSQWETGLMETLSLSDFPEVRKTTLVIKNSSEKWNIFHTIFTMKRLQRVFAYILR